MQITYSGQTEYTIDIEGYKKVLPLVQLNRDLHIASFVMLGDVGCTNHCALRLARLLRDVEFDYMVCPEAKVLPLAQALCTELGRAEFIVFRKSAKSYMREPLEAHVKSITTHSEQLLVIDGDEADKIRGKRILLIDDVVSTGGTFKAMQQLLNRVDAKIIGYAAALREGDSFPTDQLTYLADLPLFPHAKS
ncbi:MAG: phosphoribosyltransferase family protein [Oscillospiraceae bacterium]